MIALLQFSGMIVWLMFDIILLGLFLALGFVGSIVAAILILVVGPFVSAPPADEF